MLLDLPVCQLAKYLDFTQNPAISSEVAFLTTRLPRVEKVPFKKSLARYHPLLHAGLSRRTVTAIFQQPTNGLLWRLPEDRPRNRIVFPKPIVMFILDKRDFLIQDIRPDFLAIPAEASRPPGTHHP
jgi:hypothetical protein